MMRMRMKHRNGGAAKDQAFTKQAVMPLVAECCNRMSDDRCLGAFFRLLPDGQLFHWIAPEVAEKPCAVLEGRPCEFFEQTILPLADRIDARKDARQAKLWKKARAVYLHAVEKSGPGIGIDKDSTNGCSNSCT